VDGYLPLALASAALAYVTMATGRLLLVAARAPDADVCAAWTAGLLGICLGVYALTTAFPLSAAAAFGIVAVVVLGLEIALARRHGPLPDWRASIGFALCVAFTAAWCNAPAGAYEVLRAEGALPVWPDFFIHGGLISQFGDPRAVTHQSIYLADHPSSFYHYASYAAAAALAGMLDQPGLPMATAAWLPLGFLAMSAGAYALGERLAGAAGGLAALAAIVILPDASSYGLRNGAFSFHWMVLAAPGATYALGAAFLSLVLLDRWIAERSPGALIASALLAGSMLFFRAHLFLLYFPAWLATAIFCSAPERSRKALLATLPLAGVGIAGAATVAVAHLESTRLGYWFRGLALDGFLTHAHTAQEPTAYTGVYADLASRHGGGVAIAAGILLAFVAALGAFLILFPAAMALARRCGVLRPIDACPAFLALCWLLLMVFAPVPWHGDPTELIHRPVVLLYAGAAIWTLCLALRCLATQAGEVANRRWPAVLAGALLALPAIVAGAQSMASPKFRWGQNEVAKRVEPGLVEAAAFLRKHARVGDIFATAGLSAQYTEFDLPTRLCALTGIPAYLSRPYLEMIKDGPRKTLASARLAALKEVDRQADYTAAIDLLRRLPVQWYAVAGEKGPRWDPGRERAAFSAGSISLYATFDRSSSNSAGSAGIPTPPADRR
jgi:hypothetical protein